MMLCAGGGGANLNGCRESGGSKTRGMQTCLVSKPSSTIHSHREVLIRFWGVMVQAAGGFVLAGYP